MRKLVIIIIIVFLGLFSKAQLRDSIMHSFSFKPNLYGNYGSYYSFISNQFAGVLNVKLGVDFNSTTKFGIGYNWIKKGLLKQDAIPGFSESRLYMRYISVFFEYAYFKTYHWEASIPVQIGLGNTYFINKDANGNNLRAANKWFVLYEPISTIQYRFLKYFAAGAGIGFRIVLPNKPSSIDHLTSVLFVVKSKVYFGDVWNDLKNRKKK